MTFLVAAVNKNEPFVIKNAARKYLICEKHHMAQVMYLISNIQSQNTHIIAFPKFLVLESYFKNYINLLIS